MRHALLAAAGLALLAGTTAARAAVDGVPVIECTAEGSFEPPYEPGSNTCPVNLTQGRDYELRHHGDWGSGKGELVNPQGVATVTVEGSPDSSYGREFRAAYTGTYQVRLSEAENGGIRVTIYTDCKNATNTQCRLPLTGRVEGVNTTNSDLDLFKTATLRKGRTYTLTITTTDASGTYTEAAVVTSGGSTVARGNTSNGGSGGAKAIKFRSPVNGSLYVRVGRGNTYSLTLR